MWSVMRSASYERENLSWRTLRKNTSYVATMYKEIWEVACEDVYYFVEQPHSSPLITKVSQHLSAWCFIPHILHLIATPISPNFLYTTLRLKVGNHKYSIGFDYTLPG